jgi:LAS superfamily LD-carboxypeptidase LdcB
VFLVVSGLALQFTEEKKAYIRLQQARWNIDFAKPLELLLHFITGLKIVLVLQISFFAFIAFSAETGIYEIPVSDYVTGRFNPEKHPLFVNLINTDIPVARKNLYLRKEAALALSKMLQDFRKEYPKIKIYVVSATRNFYSQKNIWEEKWNGKRTIAGIENIKAMKGDMGKAKAILQFSSMPGTSRHHWGTDIDINSLTNEYYEKGEGLIIYSWLSKNAQRYGYCQPYTSGRTGGYSEEKWHWSYIPLAKKFLNDWNKIYKETEGSFLEAIPFDGSVYIKELAPLYVNNINPECQ